MKNIDNIKNQTNFPPLPIGLSELIPPHAWKNLKYFFRYLSLKKQKGKTPSLPP